MNSLADLSVKQLQRAIAIKKRISGLESALSQLLGVASSGRVPARRGRPPGVSATSAVPGRRGKRDGRKRSRSAAWRAKLAAAARLRWKKAKAAGKTSL